MRSPKQSNRRKFCRILLLSVLTVLCACAEALPGKHPVEEVEGYAYRAEQAVAQAKAYSEAAKLERERSEALLAEAKEYYSKAQAAEKFCREVKRKIPKQRVVYRIKKEKCECDEVEVDESGEVKVKKKGPEYSPSDAPLE